MKKNIEIELSYSRANETIGNAIELATKIKEGFGDTDKLEIQYREHVEIRFQNMNAEKRRVRFKLNHGKLSFSESVKHRLSEEQSKIQIYDERRTEWKEIHSFNEQFFQLPVEAVYHKEAYKSNILAFGEESCLIIQNVTFYGFDGCEKRQMQYAEIEKRHIVSKEILTIDDVMKSCQFIPRTLDDTKTHLGQTVLRSREFKIAAVDELQAFVLGIFQQKCEKRIEAIHG